MAAEGGETRSSIRVRYAETDQMQVVYHTNFLIWFEVGRTEYIRERGMSYREMEGKGVFLPVLESHCRYLSPARYEDRIEVRTWIEDLRSRRIVFAYEARRGDTLLARGSTLHFCLDASRRPVRVPGWVRERLLARPDP